MSQRLKGKTALITAAGQGIGKAAALAMASEGATVWATDVNPTLLESYKGVAGVHTATLDVLELLAGLDRHRGRRFVMLVQDWRSARGAQGVALHLRGLAAVVVGLNHAKAGAAA
jgi:NAD(P)-dependent dehydrogenase (short-subunit alcohol dehydrogenase family)